MKLIVVTLITTVFFQNSIYAVCGPLVDFVFVWKPYSNVLDDNADERCILFADLLASNEHTVFGHFNEVCDNVKGWKTDVGVLLDAVCCESFFGRIVLECSFRMVDDPEWHFDRVRKLMGRLIGK